MHLLEKDRPHPQRVGQPLAVGLHTFRRITHMVTQIEAVPRLPGVPALAGAHPGAYVRRQVRVIEKVGGLHGASIRRKGPAPCSLVSNRCHAG